VSAQEAESLKIQLTAADARTISAPVLVNVIRRDNGELVESITIIRYAGHYRADSVHAYAIKDEAGKFRVRGEFALGLNEASPFVAYLAAVQPEYAA
jgi:hypothetical protein